MTIIMILIYFIGHKDKHIAELIREPISTNKESIVKEWNYMVHRYKKPQIWHNANTNKDLAIWIKLSIGVSAKISAHHRSIVQTPVVCTNAFHNAQMVLAIRSFFKCNRRDRKTKRKRKRKNRKINVNKSLLYRKVCCISDVIHRSFYSFFKAEM